MPRRPNGLLAALLLTSLVSAQRGSVPGDVLVGPAADHRVSVTRYLAAAGLEVAETDAVSGAMRVRVPVGSEAEWIARLAARADVAYAERNGIGREGLVPDDTYFGEQWSLRNTGQSGGTPGADVRAVDAWDLTTGSSSTVIAVLDTGIDSDHPEFVGRIDPNGYDFVDEDPDPETVRPHGTWVSGVICANADNDFGVAGIDWQCMVLPIKVLDRTGQGNVFDLAQGLNYCLTQPQAQIVSMSLIDYPGDSTTLTNALQRVADAGRILFACAGNGGIGDADLSWPGASPLTISIGATNRSDARAPFSGTGARLDFVAPGRDIALVAHDTSANTWTSASGCSFSTPLTAGIAGLLLARAQQLGVPQLTHRDIYDLLVLGAVDQVGPPSEDSPGRDDCFGHGRLDARAALDAVSALVNCNHGTVGVGAGGPYDVLFVDGEARAGWSRRITVPAHLPFEISVTVPPTNPQPSAMPPFFVFWATLGDQSVLVPGPLPFGIGELCFDPGPSAMGQVAGVAPFATTVPALQPGFVASVQGAIFASPQADIAVTNLVTWDVQTAPAPTIASVTPTGPAPGVTVTIDGAGFLPGLVLRVDGSVTATTAESPTRVRFVAPASATCDSSLSITNFDNQSATAPFNPSPVITQVMSAGGMPAAGGTQLCLIGENFAPGSTVSIGGNPMAITSTTTTSIVGTLPPGQVGPAIIVVTTPYGCTATATLTYT